MAQGTLKALFFDMDGVIYNSMTNHAKTWRAAFASKDIDYTDEDTYANEGRPGSETIQLAFNDYLNRKATEKEIDEVYSLKSSLLHGLPEAEIMPGILDIMALLKERSIKVMVVTGSKQPILLERLANDFGIKTDQIISGKEVTQGKPHPEPYQRALDKLGIQPNEAIVIENAPLGVQSARAANIFTIAVNTGPLADKILFDAGANLLYKNPKELYGNFDEAIKRYETSHD